MVPSNAQESAAEGAAGASSTPTAVDAAAAAVPTPDGYNGGMAHPADSSREGREATGTASEGRSTGVGTGGGRGVGTGGSGTGGVREDSSYEGLMQAIFDPEVRE